MWQVRPARPGDADAIGEVHVRSWQHAYRGVIPDTVLDALDPVRRAGLWLRIMSQPDAGQHLLVVADGSRIVGFASAGPPRDDDLLDGRHLELYAIYTDPQVWRHGAGAALMLALLAEVPAGSAVSLWVLAANPRARAFYASFGFAPDGVTRWDTFDGRQVEELRYRRPQSAEPVGREGPIAPHRGY